MNIVISGASRGIGNELVRQFAIKGHNVLAIARSAEPLGELKQNLGNVKILVLDLINPKMDLQEKIQSSFKNHSAIDVVINNAGQLINKPFMETVPKQFLQQFEANVLTAINLIQATVPHMKEGGHIVNVSSMGGFQGSAKFPGLSAYSAAKGALSVLTECLAVELQENKVNVNALALGAVQTEMLRKAFPDYSAPLEASEMAKYIMDFALTANRYYNGKVLPVALNNP